MASVPLHCCVHDSPSGRVPCFSRVGGGPGLTTSAVAPRVHTGAAPPPKPPSHMDAGKTVTLVNSPDRLMAGTPPKVGAACQSFLEKNGATVRVRAGRAAECPTDLSRALRPLAQFGGAGA